VVVQKQLAFVLGAGGSRGALQVGALRALAEAGYHPDILVGASVGAVNATYLALNGTDLSGIARLERAWLDMLDLELAPSNYLWVSLRVLLRRPPHTLSHRLEKFFIDHGLSPEVRFRDIIGVRLGILATDLNSGSPILYGQDLEQSVLNGLLASISLPPWIAPLEKEELLLVDGGVVSCLPIESALVMGATEIIALDLMDVREVVAERPAIGKLVGKLVSTIERRQLELETALAQARGVTVRRISLLARKPIDLWDFQHTPELIETGYLTAKEALATWPIRITKKPRSWFNWLVNKRS
jgi:NTE family protein